MEDVMPDRAFTRRRLLRAALSGLTGLVALSCPVRAVPDCQDDVAIDGAIALLFPVQAPLTPAPGRRDARAVWARVPPHPATSVLLFLHGYNNYVTVDVQGRSRVPDWAADDPAARAGALSKPAAPLVYGLDRLDSARTGKSFVVLVPEDGALARRSFWATTPRGQYANPARLGALIAAAFAHLACLRRLDGLPYLSLSGPDRVGLERVYLCGHSGAGLPLQEAAGSDLALPRAGVPTDLWLFDCTYWSDVANFVQFCAHWHRAGRLGARRRTAARFICVYRPHTQTEAIADILRGQIAQTLGVSAASLVKDHITGDTGDNFAAEIRPALLTHGVLFLRTSLPHDDIPTYFIPRLLETAM